MISAARQLEEWVCALGPGLPFTPPAPSHLWPESLNSLAGIFKGCLQEIALSINSSRAPTPPPRGAPSSQSHRFHAYHINAESDRNTNLRGGPWVLAGKGLCVCFCFSSAAARLGIVFERKRVLNCPSFLCKGKSSGHTGPLGTTASMKWNKIHILSIVNGSIQNILGKRLLCVGINSFNQFCSFQPLWAPCCACWIPSALTFLSTKPWMEKQVITWHTCLVVRRKICTISELVHVNTTATIKQMWCFFFFKPASNGASRKKQHPQINNF